MAAAATERMRNTARNRLVRWAQVLLGAQELDGCALLLQRVIRGARAFDLDGGGESSNGWGASGVSLTAVPVQMSAAETF